MIRVLMLAALLSPSMASAQQALIYCRPLGHDHRGRHRPGRHARVVRPPRLRDSEPVGGQLVGLGDGRRDRRAAIDRDPGWSAIPLHEPGLGAGLQHHRRDDGAGVRGARVVR